MINGLKVMLFLAAGATAFFFVAELVTRLRLSKRAETVFAATVAVAILVAFVLLFDIQSSGLSDWSERARRR